MTALLSMRGVSKSFGGVMALRDVSLEVADGEILGLIGPNGAGKTTLLNCVSGVYRPDAGEIRFDGRSLRGLGPHQVARALCTRPRLLLLDEVMAGLNAVEIDAALGMARDVHARGLTIVLIEHVMRVIVGVCERVIVLAHGTHLAEGRPQEVLNDERVIRAYLGEKYAKRHSRE